MPSRPTACPSRSASTAALTPRTRRCRRPSPPGGSASRHLVRISSRDPEPPSLEYVRTSGGLFLDMTIHDFDMARFVTGSEVVEVFARGGVRVAPDVRRGRRHRHRDRDAGARQRLPHRDRQLPRDRVRLRSARGGVRLGRHGGIGEPAGPHRRAHDRRRASSGPRSRTSSSSAICRATSASGRPSSGRCRPGQRRRWASQDARAPLVIGLAACSPCARAGPCAWTRSRPADADLRHRRR